MPEPTFGKLVTINGRTRTQAAWLRDIGLSERGYYDRLERGWSVERALTEPCQDVPGQRDIAHDGRTQSLGAWARELGLSRQTIRYRLKQGWSVHRALTTPSTNKAKPMRLEGGTAPSQAAAARALGIPESTLRARRSKGAPVDGQGVKRGPKPKLISWKGRRQTAKQWARELDVPLSTINYRHARRRELDSGRPR